MPFRPPTEADLRDLADSLFLELTGDELEFFAEMAEQRTDVYETVRSYDPESRLGGDERRERTVGVRVPDEDDPHNAWVSVTWPATTTASSQERTAESRITSPSPASN